MEELEGIGRLVWDVACFSMDCITSSSKPQPEEQAAAEASLAGVQAAASDTDGEMSS